MVLVGHRALIGQRTTISQRALVGQRACSSARFARSPAQLKALLIATRLGSARYLGRPAHPGSWLGLGLGPGWGLGYQLNAMLISKNALVFRMNRYKLCLNIHAAFSSVICWYRRRYAVQLSKTISSKRFEVMRSSNMYRYCHAQHHTYVYLWLRSTHCSYYEFMTA